MSGRIRTIGAFIRLSLKEGVEHDERCAVFLANIITLVHKRDSAGLRTLLDTCRSDFSFLPERSRISLQHLYEELGDGWDVGENWREWALLTEGLLGDSRGPCFEGIAELSEREIKMLERRIAWYVEHVRDVGSLSRRAKNTVRYAIMSEMGGPWSRPADALRGVSFSENQERVTLRLTWSTNTSYSFYCYSIYGA